jgi:hypothetical protein
MITMNSDVAMKAPLSDQAAPTSRPITAKIDAAEPPPQKPPPRNPADPPPTHIHRRPSKHKLFRIRSLVSTDAEENFYIPGPGAYNVAPTLAATRLHPPQVTSVFASETAKDMFTPKGFSAIIPGPVRSLLFLLLCLG